MMGILRFILKTLSGLLAFVHIIFSDLDLTLVSHSSYHLLDGSLLTSFKSDVCFEQIPKDASTA